MNNDTVSQHLQDCFVLLAITDNHFLSIARKSVKPSYFSTIVTEDIIQICYRYHDQFKTAPNDHFHDELVRFLEGKAYNERKRYVDYLDEIVKLNLPSKEYIISRFNTFIKSREFTEAALNFVDLVEKGEFEQGRMLITKALRAGMGNTEKILRYLSSSTPTYYNPDHYEELFTAGFGDIDRFIKFRRKQLICILGGGKGKKSWICHHISVRGLLAGLKVLYISHELSQEEVEMRHDMMIGGLTSSPASEEVEFNVYDRSGEIVRTEIKTVDSVFNRKKIEDARGTARKFGGELIIKKYPMGTCTIGEIDRLLDHLEVFEKFIPDIIINDYPDIMNMPHPSSTTRDRLNETYIEHKRIADERNVIVFVPSQTNRIALDRPRLTKQDIAEDIRKLANVDMILAVAQSSDLKAEGKMRAMIIAARSSDDGKSCLFSQNLKAGLVVGENWLEGYEKTQH